MHAIAQSCPTHWDLWAVARQAPLSMGFSRQEHWSGHTLLQAIFLTQGLNPGLLCLLYWQVGSLPLGSPVNVACHLDNKGCGRYQVITSQSP